MSSTVGEFKGHPTIKLVDDNDESDKPLFISFGMKKAKLILAHIDDIKSFVGSEGRSQNGDQNF